jgi:outer membrane protein
MRTRVVLTLLAGLFGFATAEAQVGTRLPQMSLDAAVTRAIELSEEVQVARVQRSLAESQIVQARAGALPDVTANVVYNRTLASIFDNIRFPFPIEEEENGNGEGPLGALPFGRPHIWIATVQFSQPIYAGGRVGAALDVARNVRQAAELELREAEAEITLQVRAAYFQLVLAEELIGISEEAYRLADEQLRQIELFRQQGTASDFDVLRARVERDNLEPRIVEARNARRLADLGLKRLINLPAEQPLETTTPLAPEISDVDREALRAAVSQRASIRALDEVVAAREGALRIARADWRPSVNLAGNFSFQAFPDQIAPVDNWRRDWTLGFQVSMPVFTGFRRRGLVEQAEAELQTAQLQRVQLSEGLDIELEAALGDFDAARAQIEARRATVGQARRALELAELRFRSGLAIQLEISNARLMLEQARVNEIQALFDYVNALARLERSSGGTVPLLAARLPQY